MATEITLLGAPGVCREGEAVSFDTRKAMALLAHLAMAERPRPREQLCELLWPGRDVACARGALRRTLSTLRSGLGEAWLETTGDTIALRRGDGLEIDVDRFRALAAAGDLAGAVAVSRGAFLEGFAVRDSPDFEHWHSVEQNGLERELAAALRGLVQALGARGEFEAAIAHARRWLAADPVHEPAHRELIRLYAVSGERTAALEQYRTCVRTLSDELGVAPLEETAELYEQVNAGTVPSPAAAAPAPPPQPVASATEAPLVGRAAELDLLAAAHAGATTDGQLVVIEGEAGIGKTRLAEVLEQRARDAGAAVLSARCHDDEAGIPYGPIVELLRAALPTGTGWADDLAPQRLADAALLLPELAALRDGTPAPPPLDGPGARVRLLEGVAAVLTAACAGPPGVVVLDDVHAADEATLDALAFLGRRLTGRPLLLVLTWRSEFVAPGHRLRRLVSDVTRTGRVTVVRPARLTEADVAELVRRSHPDATDERLAERVFSESEGLPLFAAEYLAALRSGDGGPGGLRFEVRGLLEARLVGVSPVARQVLGAAAAIGRSFGVDTVRVAGGRGHEETVSALEELVARGLVREGDSDYDFSHSKLRALVYDDTSLARRRLLHARVGAALARAQPGGEQAALVAKHLQLAGDSAGAAAAHRRAADHAAGLFAHAETLEQLEAALALGDPAAAELHERIGDVRTLLGDYAGALASYGSAAAHAENALTPATIEHKLGDIRHRRGEWERAEAHLRAALEREPGPGLRARVVADLALTLYHAGRVAQATELADTALDLAEVAGDHRARAQAHNLLGILARAAGDSGAAIELLERSLELATELGSTPAQAAALNNLALVRHDTGDDGAALALTERALALCAASGDRHREAALENNLADLHHAAGRSTESMEHLRRAVTLFAEVGADEASRLPEIWKLVNW